MKKSYTEYFELSCQVAKGFIALGLESRLSVAIIGYNAEEWLLSEMGAIFAGGISVGMYETNSPQVCRHIMSESRANIAVVENEEQLAKIMSIKDQLPDLKAIIQYRGNVPSMDGVLSWSQLLAIGKLESDQVLQDRLQAMAINECCQLIYTSGTTGPPKGVMLSHDNLSYFGNISMDQYKMYSSSPRTISYLPLSHIAAKAAEIYVPMAQMSSIYFTGKDALKGCLVDYLKEVKPTYFLGVPRVYEKIQEKMMEISHSNSKLKQMVGDWAKKTALKHQDNEDKHSDLRFRLADKMVFQNVKAALGLDQCEVMLSGAAPISQSTLEYFTSLNLHINDAYGMSETTGPALTNVNEMYRMGSLGKPLIGYDVCIRDPVTNETLPHDHTGEICMKGRHIMMGYLGKVKIRYI